MVSGSRFPETTSQGETIHIKDKEMKVWHKEVKTSQTYRAVLPKSAPRGLMQGLGLAFLACTLVIGATGSARAGARDEEAVRALGGSFAKAFVEKNAELRASLFAENGPCSRST